MRTIAVLIRKEFTQIRRNRIMIPAMIIAPLIQMIILVYAANMNMRDIDFAILDEDGSATSINLISKYSSSPFFSLSGSVNSLDDAEKLLKGDKADLVIHIPPNFENSILNQEKADVQFLINGINSAAAVLTASYAQNILFDYNRQLIAGFSRPSSVSQGFGTIEVNYSHWYNPGLDFKIFMVPGILVVLVTLVGWLLMSLNVVREKELGTIEQINVTPIKKYQFLMGKLIPFWILAIIELGIGLTLGRLLFHVPILGSLWLLIAFTAIYLVTVLGFGLFIAAISETQQQVMFVNFFFVLVFILMSGIFTPVESMPDWAHYVNIINPLSYFMRVIRMILLKGSDFGDVWKEFLSMGIFGVVMITLSVRSYRKRV
ncbi:MAG: ABC transporter permease [Porphyromonadaceae bacterium]|nr:MAG: ABC transporter permease [Porphyromonadaceae bacterium]